LLDYEIDRAAVCPSCGSSNVEQQLSVFYPVSSKKSAWFGTHSAIVHKIVIQ